MKRPFEGLGFTFEIIITRILTLAKTHFADRPDTYRRMESEAKNGSYGVATMVCAIQPAEWQYHVLRNEQHILDVRLLKLIDEWEHGKPTPTGKRVQQTGTDTGQSGDGGNRSPEAKLQWWQKDHDILSLAQDIGEKLHEENEKKKDNKIKHATSNRKISAVLAKRIREIEGKAAYPRSCPNSETVRKAALTGWEFIPK